MFKRTAAVASLSISLLFGGCATQQTPTPPAVPQATITTVAGDGTYGYAGDGGTAVAAELGEPTCAVVDGAGNLYIADVEYNVIRKVSPNGTIETYAGHQFFGYSGDGGPATAAYMDGPTSCALDAAGDLYFTDIANNVVRRIDATTGIITTVAGDGYMAGTSGGGFSGDGGPATLAKLNHPSGVIVDTAGDLYIGDTSNNRVRRVDTKTGIITTVAGTGVYGFSGDGGLATLAELAEPTKMAFDAEGTNLYICDTANGSVRKLALASGTITTVAGTGQDGPGNGISVGDGGPAVKAAFQEPDGVALDAAGNLYISDSGDNVVRLVAATTGIVTTFAGDGTAEYTGDGGAPNKAGLHNPEQLTFDAVGDLYIADSYNAAVRKVTF